MLASVSYSRDIINPDLLKMIAVDVVGIYANKPQLR